MIKRIKIHSYELGLYFRSGEFQRVLSPGVHWLANWPGKTRVDIVSQRDPWLLHTHLDVIVKSGALDGFADVIDLTDHQRALVWIDNRFYNVLSPGLCAYWTGFRDVRIETLDVADVRFQHAEIKTIVRSANASAVLDICSVERDHVGIWFNEGRFVEQLGPGQYAFWKGVANANLVEVDMREQALDVAGQEIMTADKVTLRMNAAVNFRVVDARKAITASEGYLQALYRDAQLALRAVVGCRNLDSFLTDKDSVAEELKSQLSDRAGELGLDVIAVGVRDVILPGEMKDLMNKVTEARKAAEANLISRREETAAMRSQANTAKLLVDNPTLMRLRELEVLEKVATEGNLNIMLGEKGLAERVVNLL